MGKRQKTGREHQPQREGQVAGPEVQQADPSLVQQDALGNQALQASIDGPDVEAEVGLDVVRDTAIPMVDHALLALQLLAPRDVSHERLVEILERSSLPGREGLIARLDETRSQIDAVREAVERLFGDAGAAEAALDATLRGLEGGSAAGADWQTDAGAVALSGGVLAGSVSDRAEALVSDLAQHLAPPASREASGGSPGRAASELCRALFLAVAFDEEEEEELVDGWSLAPEQA